MPNDEEMEAKAPGEGEPPSPLVLARSQLVEGERLIWAETSLPSSARRRVFPISILGWLFLLLTLAWLVKAAVTSTWLLIMGLPFLLAALALAVLPWWWPLVTRYTIYAISDQRLLIIQTWPRRRVTSYGPEDIDVVERQERKDGSGDLIFRREEHRKLAHHHDPKGKRRVGERAIGFFGVPDVRRLEEAVWALKQRRRFDLEMKAAQTSHRGHEDDHDRPESKAEDPSRAQTMPPSENVS
ncbi:MAG: hypothetical protein AAGA21_04100 [Pseudomonadota bacterium]